MTDELAMIFMSTVFDLDKLTPEQIVELKKNKNDLRAFKDELASIAARVSKIPDPQDRQQELQEYADEIVDRWNAHRKGILKAAADAVHDAFKQELKPADLGVVTTLSGNGFWLGGPIGLGIGIALYGGYKIWRAFSEKTAGPYQYLSDIERAGAERKALNSAAILRPQRA